MYNAHLITNLFLKRKALPKEIKKKSFTKRNKK